MKLDNLANDSTWIIFCFACLKCRYVIIHINCIRLYSCLKWKIFIQCKLDLIHFNIQQWSEWGFKNRAVWNITSLCKKEYCYLKCIESFNFWKITFGWLNFTHRPRQKPLPRTRLLLKSPLSQHILAWL